MILRKLKKLIELYLTVDKIYEQSRETEWAHIYHDSIRGKRWLEELAIYPGRWAANYSFLYILVRILTDYKPSKIIEFGLGESSKVVSKFVQNELTESQHIIVEQDIEWAESFVSRFALSKNSQIIHLEREEKDIKNFIVNSYTSLPDKINALFDLYIIDGPFGSDRYSRYDICLLANKFESTDEFIIIMDDYIRKGEQDTAKDLVDIITSKGIKTYVGVYSGNNSQMVVATTKYRNAVSM